MQVQPHCETNFVWKLKKWVYGLSDASLKWSNQIKASVLVNWGKVSETNPPTFYMAWK